MALSKHPTPYKHCMKSVCTFRVKVKYVPYSVRMRKIQTRITPNMYTFHAVSSKLMIIIQISN